LLESRVAKPMASHFFIPVPRNPYVIESTIIKIDVETHEADVMLGAIDTIKKFKP
jgi:hypothetical protein